MSVSVRIPTILRTYTDGESEVTAAGSTLSDVLDDLLRLAATAGTDVQVAADAGAARPAWSSAPLVLLGPDVPEDCARLGLPRRSDVVLVAPPRKKPISIRVDEDVLDYFKREGGGYQRRMNAVLRSYMQQKKSKRRA